MATDWRAPSAVVKRGEPYPSALVFLSQLLRGMNAPLAHCCLFVGPPLSSHSSAAEANERRGEAPAAEMERSRLPGIEAGRQEERRGRRIDRRLAGGRAVNDIAFLRTFGPNRRRARARPARRCTGEGGLPRQSHFLRFSRDSRRRPRRRSVGTWRRRRELYECYVEEMRRSGHKRRPGGVHTERDNL